MAKLKELVASTEVQVEHKATLVSFDLPERMTDEEIEADLPAKHLFDIKEVYIVVAGLVAKQSQGEEGALLANGNWNLFYTDKKVVGVLWGGGGWGVGCWGRGDGGWDAGVRVFFPATEA